MSEAELAERGEAMTKTVCGVECHGLDVLDHGRRTSGQWSDVVTDMVTRGAPGTEDQIALVTRYLHRYYGFVQVNIATAQELAAVLGFSAKEAQAIVDYRAAHGRFTDANAVGKVPGIDKTRLEEQPEAMRFN